MTQVEAIAQVFGLSIEEARTVAVQIGPDKLRVWLKEKQIDVESTRPESSATIENKPSLQEQLKCAIEREGRFLHHFIECRTNARHWRMEEAKADLNYNESKEARIKLERLADNERKATAFGADESGGNGKD